ncbi:iron export ABC transporter permease subunit FetB [Lentisphaera profundi]|uniref:Iron export ABC transporter permease subunit FetB n=1 Tax=Lentisphaera profundi TaxID=1658616 RepID=A0ABY7VQ44_9BACT|nr:iron export ABC transporter permease subunit FetB [Lentisphaera profundi]WDE96305.1 iron export ABC transporter permease subunit FetB [Lentisphaera profundi]
MILFSSMQISNLQLAGFGIFVLLTAFISFRLKLGLAKSLIIGSLRTYAQLLIMGFALIYIFQYPNPYVSLAVYVWMIFWAARIISGRVENPPFPLFKVIFVTMLLTYLILNISCLGLFLQAEPWYAPQFFITIGGMIVGNSMNAMAISLERFFSDLKNRRMEIEQNLLMGMNTKDAISPLVREAIKAGMTPSINNLAGVGLVFIPGMMTGQILGGEDPMNAAKYQIMIMLIICVSTALGSILVISQIAKKCFNERHQLKV